MAVTMNPAEAIRIIATGGTIDKFYDPIAGALAFDRTRIDALLLEARLQAPVELEVAMLIDSLDMTDAHRHEILVRCRHAPERRIVITHGTDTMAETAAVLGGADLGRTVVLTGAMVPWSLAGSDAAFNLGYALACARMLPTGVYVAMNGLARPWNDVRKDRGRGVFTGRDD